MLCNAAETKAVVLGKFFMEGNLCLMQEKNERNCEEGTMRNMKCTFTPLKGCSHKTNA